MRDHPIPSVTEPLQYRAIGLVRGKYIPDSDTCFSRGRILDANGLEIESVLLGRVISLIKNRLEIAKSHLWVVYPRCRDSEHLHLQIGGIWEPSTLAILNSENKDSLDNKLDIRTNAPDQVFQGDDYFSIRGELIFSKPETKDIVLKIRRKKKNNSNRSFPFKLNLKGEIPIQFLRNFVSLDVRRLGQKLHVEKNEIIAPIKEHAYKGVHSKKKLK